MFELTFPRNGAILNHNHGEEAADGLEIDVKGIGGESGFVTVNGIPAEFDGTGFSVRIKLTSQYNTIKAVLEDSRGRLTREIQVVWDKCSYKRYDFFIDDHSFFLTDIASQRPKSLFEHFYLKFLKEMNGKYGTKFTLNLFFRNHYDANGFTLEQFPDCYKTEWEDNSDWLRLAFHANCEFPDRTYQNADAAAVAHDIDQVNEQIVRFAGERTLTPPVALHWAMARPETFAEFTRRGVRALEGQFINPRTGINDSGSQDLVCDVGYFLNLDDCRYLEAQGALYDFRHQLAFYRGDCTANLWTQEQIAAKIARASSSKRDFISLASHEQYSFPYYFNYIPDHHQRIERCISECAKRNYKPVFFSEGLFGNTAWED